MNDIDIENIREQVIEALKTVEDPEIPVNLYDLGLIYDLKIAPSEEKVDHVEVRIQMTLTTPNCPVAESMPMEVQKAVKQVDGVSRASISLVWNPPWTSERMTEDGRLMLDFLGISWKDPKIAPTTGASATGLTVNRRDVDNKKS